jgi:predicted ArsR family transcriptional regulator
MGRSRRVSDEELIQEINAAPDPFVTASEMAERIDYSRDGALRRLRDLEERGYVRSRNVGANAVVWWLTDTGKDVLR